MYASTANTPLETTHKYAHVHPHTPHTHTQLLKSISEEEGNPLILLGKVEFSYLGKEF